jgi:hypothetical protein
MFLVIVSADKLQNNAPMCSYESQCVQKDLLVRNVLKKGRESRENRLKRQTVKPRLWGKVTEK